MYRTYRMGRKRWQKVLDNLRGNVNKANRVDGISRREYQQKIKHLESVLAALVNVIQHRGNRGPARWPRDRKQRGTS
jgi:hypothetical protein